MADCDRDKLICPAARERDEMRATLTVIEKLLLQDSAAKDSAGNIETRNFVGRAILLCRKHG